MKVLIKLSRKHPHNAMSFGRYMITNQDQEIELNDAEVKDLENDGPKYWFTVSKAEEKPKKKVTKKVSKKVK